MSIRPMGLQMSILRPDRSSIRPYSTKRHGAANFAYKRVERYQHPIDATSALLVTRQGADGPETYSDPLQHRLPQPLEVSTGTCGEHAFYYGVGPFLFIPAYSHWAETEYGISRTIRVYTTNVLKLEPVIELMLGETKYFQAKPDLENPDRLVVEALDHPELSGGETDVTFAVAQRDGDRMGVYWDDQQYNSFSKPYKWSGTSLTVVDTQTKRRMSPYGLPRRIPPMSTITR